jgi:hypothetical protein
LWDSQSLVSLIRFPCYFLFYQVTDQEFRWKRFERVGGVGGEVGKIRSVEVSNGVFLLFPVLSGEGSGDWLEMG